jgi:hypothetical protein
VAGLSIFELWSIKNQLNKYWGNHMRWFVSFLVFLTVLACEGCGGGGGGNAGAGGGTGAVGSSQSSASTLSGLAATGAAISGRVYLVDASGHDRYVDTTDGHFSFDLAGLQSPLLLKVQWIDASGIRRLYSFASSGGVANITPLTHFAVTTAAGTDSLDSLYAAPSAKAFAAMQEALPAAIARLQTYLQPMLQLHGVASANPMTASFASDHTGMDAVLDNLLVSYSGDNVMLADKATGATLVATSLSPLAGSVSAAHWSVADAARAAEVAVAISNKGLGLVLWTEPASAHTVLKARLGNGLDAGVTLSSTGDAGAPRVAFDAAGNALAVWTVFSNQRNTLWSSRFSAASSQWEAARMLSAPDAVASAYLPDLALDQAGNAMVVWHQGDGRANHFDGWAAQYAVATGRWSAATRVTDGISNVHSTRVALNAAGQGWLAWAQERGDGTTADSQPVDVWARSVSTTAAWGTGSIVSASGGTVGTAYVYGQIALAVNAAGDAAVLWSQRLLPARPMVVRAALFKPAGGWQDASTITLDSTEDCHDPAVALDAAGNAVAVWQQQTDYGAYGGSNRYVAGAGWGTPGHFVDSKLGDAFSPSVAMDGAGNATVVWYRWSPANAIDLMINHYQLGTGWGGAQVFAPMGSNDVMTQSPPQVASNAMGQTLVVWGINLSAVASWL